MSAADTQLRRRYHELKRALFDKYYSDLNDRQREAVTTVNGPLLVLAGAGSGKTTVLVRRIVHIIKYGDAYNSDFVPPFVDEAALKRYEYALGMTPEEIGRYVLPEFRVSPCRPYQMLAITFTNKAAGEIKSRLAAALAATGTDGSDAGGGAFDGGASEIWAGTFHSICMRILRRWGELVGYRRDFTVYDTDDSKRLISDCMKDLRIDEKTLPVKTVMNSISRAKDRLLTPEKYAAVMGGDYRGAKIAEIYRMYAERLMASNALDFDDIIMKTVQLLTEHEDVRDHYTHQFRYVSVDEYQDTNHAQFRLTSLLTGEHNNLMVVGDDDQSIYKFRGATIENILSFDHEFDDVAVIKLEQNYRSTSTILNAANAIIANNKGRHEKSLWCAGEAGAKISLRELGNQNDEAKYIADKIERLVATGTAQYRDFAVLYRMNAQSAPIEGAFAKAGMPYRMLGGLRFYDRKEIRDIVAYLSVIANPDDSVRLKRIINEPKRKIGATAVAAAEEIAAVEGCSVYDVLKNAGHYMALSRAAAAIAGFVQLIETLREFAAASSVAELIDRTMELSGYREMLVAGGEAELDRLENLDQLVSNAYEYAESNEEASLTGFLEDVALVSEVDRYDDTADAVVMMTIHSAKGLEFPTVFLPGMEEGIFPGQQSSFNPEELEEERRLAYVAVTRAKEQVFITRTHSRMLYGQTRFNPPSRFIAEIPPECVIDETPQEAPRRAESTPQRRPEPVYKNGAGVKVEVKKQQPPPPSEIFAPGDIVRHRTFGRGEVISAAKMGQDVMYEIIFDDVGTKKLMATYAKLTKEN